MNQKRHPFGAWPFAFAFALRLVLMPISVLVLSACKIPPRGRDTESGAGKNSARVFDTAVFDAAAQRLPVTANAPAAADMPVDASRASAASGTATTRKAWPVPAAPQGVDAETLAILNSICAVGYTQGAGGKALGCRAHPPFDLPGQAPDGTLLEQPEESIKFCALTALYRGAFTRPLATQALLAFGPCYEGANDGFESNAYNSESAVLVEEIAGRFQIIRYEAALHATRCKVDPRADSTAVLLCDGGFAAMSMGEIRYLFEVDFTGSETNAHSVVSLFADVFDCGSFERSGFHQYFGLTALRAWSTQVVAPSAGATSRASVSLERARAVPSPTLDAKLKRMWGRLCFAPFSPRDPPVGSQRWRTCSFKRYQKAAECMDFASPRRLQRPQKSGAVTFARLRNHGGPPDSIRSRVKPRLANVRGRPSLSECFAIRWILQEMQHDRLASTRLRSHH
jgi:hypothetical protein